MFLTEAIITERAFQQADGAGYLNAIGHNKAMIWEGYLWWMRIERISGRYGVFFVSDLPNPEDHLFEYYEPIDDWLIGLRQANDIEPYEALYRNYGRLWIEPLDKSSEPVLLGRGHLVWRVWQDPAYRLVRSGNYHEIALLKPQEVIIPNWNEPSQAKEIANLNPFALLNHERKRIRVTFEQCQAPPPEVYRFWYFAREGYDDAESFEVGEQREQAMQLMQAIEDWVRSFENN